MRSMSGISSHCSQDWNKICLRFMSVYGWMGWKVFSGLAEASFALNGEKKGNRH